MKKARLKSVAVYIDLTPNYYIQKGWNEYTPILGFDVIVGHKRYGISLPVPLNETIDDEEHIRTYSELYARKVCEKLAQSCAGVDCKELHDSAFATLPNMFRCAIDTLPYRQTLIEDPTFDLRGHILKELKACKKIAYKEGFTQDQFYDNLHEAIDKL